MKDLITGSDAPAPPPRSARRQHVLIIGGGASGVLMATHLLSQTGRDFHITLIERRSLLGCGLAYSTEDPDHLLNTRVHNMSAFPDAPQHFHDWLTARPDGAQITDQCFVSRATYGAYLADLLKPWTTGRQPSRLRCVTDDCLRLEETARGVVAHFADGSAQLADIAVLATGHVLPEPCADGVLSDPWTPGVVKDPTARVMIIGSGLTMVDQVLSLLKCGHQGEIVALSRRGLLPRGHTATRPIKLTLAELPLGAPASALMAWVRRLARKAETEGGTWRDAVDGIRPHLRNLWRGLSHDQRARFLRHGATWWDVHRHRIPPASQGRIDAAIASGQLRQLQGRFLGARRGTGDQIIAQIQPRGETNVTELTAARIVDCRGIRRDPETNATPLIADLLARGLARIDPLRIGLDVTLHCRVINRDGKPSRQIYAIGPVSRAAFWEITAIPDIREQTARLSSELAVR